MRPFNHAFARPVSERGRMMAQDRIGQKKKKKTVECRPLIMVSLPAQFEAVEINPAPDDAAHYRKTAPP